MLEHLHQDFFHMEPDILPICKRENIFQTFVLELSGAYWIYPDLISIVTTFDTKESDWKSVEFPKQPLPFIPHILHVPYIYLQLS